MYIDIDIDHLYLLLDLHRSENWMYLAAVFLNFFAFFFILTYMVKIAFLWPPSALLIKT
jgi:hypothetical protein